MSVYRTPGRSPIPKAVPATGGVTLRHLLEFNSVVHAPAMAIESAQIAGGGPLRIAIAAGLTRLVIIALGLSRCP